MENELTDPVKASPGRLRPWMVAAVLAVACAAAFSNSFRGVLTFDDYASVRDNKSIRHLWPIWPVLTPGPNKTVTARPVLNLSLAINYALGGERLFGYHLGNLLIQFAAALLVFGICRRTFLNERVGQRINSAATPLAGAISLLWAIHPLQTESVTYIIQRAESLLGLFCLLSLYLVIRSASSRRPGRWQVLAVLSCLLGMGTKESMATAPILILLYDRIFLASSFREVFTRRWKLYAGFAATYGLLAVLMISSGARGGTAGAVVDLSSFQYARSQFGVILHYLRLVFWPYPLVLDYGWPVAESLEEILPGLVVVGLLLAGTIWALWKKPTAAYLGLWFFIILAPTSSIVPILDLAFEHRMYLPLAAVMAAIVLGAFWLGGQLVGRGKLSPRQAGLLAAALLVLALAAEGARTFQRNQDYADELAMWEQTVRDVPNNWRAHVNLGNKLMRMREFDRSLEQYNLGLSLKKVAQAYNERGMVLNSMDRPQEAIADFGRAIKLQDDYAEAYANRGNVEVLNGRPDLAMQDLNKALSILADFAPAFNLRGLAYQAMGKTDLALQDLAKAIQLDPKYAQAYCNRGMILAKAGHLAEAMKDLDKALELSPDYHEAYVDRAIAHFQMGKTEAAMADYAKAIELRPTSAAAYFSRSEVYRNSGQMDKAEADLHKATELDPRYGAAYNNLAFVLLQSDRTPEALACSQKAVDLLPDSSIVYETRADVYFHLKDYGRAWADVKKCRELGGQPEDAFIQKLRQASGRAE